MRRREFITQLGGVALAWPLAARAEQADRTRRVGVLMGYAETDPQAKALLAEFTRAVSEFGWIEGRNLRMDVRWVPGNTVAASSSTGQAPLHRRDVVRRRGDFSG